ncbi:MAG: M48 family metallopeptidase [Sphingosinicella sp.]
MNFDGSALLAGAEIRLRRSLRARRLSLRVDPRSGAVLLTVPGRMAPKRALAWAAQHQDWIEAQLARLPGRQALVPGTSLPLFGVPHLIDHDPASPRRVEPLLGRLLVGGPSEGFEARLLRWLKAEALALLTKETAQYCRRAGKACARVSVGDPASRWGSCSASGRIRYSWRLLLTPDFVRRATVAHEVAHLVHLDHSRAFHILVEQLLGSSPKPARDWLRRHGAALHRIGR